jgi:hypothetical protein
MVASDPQSIATYLKYLKQAVDRVRGRPGVDAKSVTDADALHGDVSARAAAAQSDEAAAGDGSHAKALLASLVAPLRQLMGLTARLQSALGGSPQAAGTAAATGDLQLWEWLGQRLTIGRYGRRTRAAGEQWKAQQVIALTQQRVKLRDHVSGFVQEWPLADIAKDLASSSPSMFKRISGPEAVADVGVYVEKGMLKTPYRGSLGIRKTFYNGDYGAYADSLRAVRKSAAQASPLSRTSGLGPDAWLCPGFKRAPHLIVEGGHVDHRVPVAQHWTDLGGNNTDQDARRAFNLDSANLQLLCDSCNLSKGSKTMDGAGTTYVDSVGALFTGPDGKR